jgi:hypothetical protein
VGLRWQGEEGRFRDRRRPVGRCHARLKGGGRERQALPRVFVGLGDATEITAVEVSWPVAGRAVAAMPQTFRGFAPGRHYLLKQGAAGPVELKRPPIALSHVPPAPHVHK